MKKKLIHTAAFILTLLVSVPAAQASGAGEANITHITHSNAHSMNGFANRNSFHFRLHVLDTPFSQIMMRIPAGLSVDEEMIQVTNGDRQPINATVSLDGGLAVISLSEAVPADSTVEILIKEVRGPRYISNYLFPISIQPSGTESSIPLGLAEVRTF